MNREEHGEARAGKLTGSMAKRLMAGNYRTWNKLLDEIRNPVKFGSPTENWPIQLQWGVKYEPMSCAKFWERHPEFEMLDPKYVPYWDEQDELRRKWIGVSPDRMLSMSVDMTDQYVAGLECKTPFKQEIHEKYRADGIVPRDHIAQCCWGILTTGVPEWYFISYDPRTDDLFCPKPINAASSRTYLHDMAEKADRFLEVLDMGERFVAVTPSAKQLHDMF